MRHEKTALLMALARALAASSTGLTLDEMAEVLGSGRRTAERMRDRLEDLFPGLEEIRDPPTKRWRIASKLDSFLKAPTAAELAALKTARDVLVGANPAAAADLEALESKLLATMGSKLNRLEPDIEALMQAEALAIQPGARAMADRTKLSVLRDGLLMLRQVRFTYLGGSRSGAVRTVVPYGLLFGGEVYLVARETGKPEASTPAMWRLDRIETPEILDGAGGPPEGFSLSDFARRSFGVFQEDTTVDVTLRVLPDYAEEARRWLFHSSQSFETAPDGALIVRLHGGGLRELAWSLFRWGGKLEIIEPEALRREMRGALAAAQTMLPDS